MIPKRCDRCGCKTTTFKGSYFDTAMLCNGCMELENRHPDLFKAKHIEHAEVLKGNMNYEGIGCPKDLLEISLMTQRDENGDLA